MIGNTVMELFEPYDRDYLGPARRYESHFSYLDRSARPEMGKVRELTETWLSRYPSSHRTQLASRLSSEDDINHLSSFFELLLYEMLRRTGPEIEIEPSVEGSTKRPDFLVRSGAAEFYVEATLGIESGGKSRSSAMFKIILDQIDQIRSDHFFVMARYEGTIKNTPSKQMITNSVEFWLNNLRPDLVTKAHIKGDNDAYSHEIKIDDGLVKLTPILKCEAGLSSRLIGSEMSTPRYVTTIDTIHGRVLDKAGRYGKLKRPYVIALNVFALSVDQDDVLDALFGRRAFRINWESNDSAQMDSTRLQDGALYDNRGIRYSRVSGVIWTHGLISSNLPSKTLELICNPFAAFPLMSVGLPLPTLVAGDDHFEEVPGLTVGKILGLAPSWPEDD